MSVDIMVVCMMRMMCPMRMASIGYVGLVENRNEKTK